MDSSSSQAVTREKYEQLVELVSIAIEGSARSRPSDLAELIKPLCGVGPKTKVGNSSDDCFAPGR